jgi:hypothetical protein
MAAIIEIPWVAIGDDGSVLIDDDLVLLGPGGLWILYSPVTIISDWAGEWQLTSGGT